MGTPLHRDMGSTPHSTGFHSVPAEFDNKKELDALNEKIKHLQAFDAISDLTIESLCANPELLDVVEAGQKFMVLGKKMIDEAAKNGIEESASGGPQLIGIGYDLINRISKLVEHQQQRLKLAFELGRGSLLRAPSLLRGPSPEYDDLPPSFSALQLLKNICDNVKKLPLEVDINLKDKISRGAKDLQEKLDRNETLSPLDLDRLSLMFLLCEQYQAKGTDVTWANKMVKELAQMLVDQESPNTDMPIREEKPPLSRPTTDHLLAPPEQLEP